MQTTQTAKGKRPPLAEYIRAGQADLRIMAKIERALDLVPGGLMACAVEGAGGSDPDAWAAYIAGGYCHEDGSPYTAEEVADMARKLAPIVGEAAQ